ncbi:glycosyl transferase [Marinisporobacter balticus]|uniref:UDP-N-acetylmuramyl pentapeptide phosphotransferase/UDP-N-acetylglucosamine-1-phosphate transferase n=1 Tax=Marinisporobacter balticus TaxID=2018667 RepID=A0A4R2LKD0_9FIRM|nr:glycosyl transferase [Marinisporobacter balticus]TCO79835.1 UDP-N-acetylmuramyl pentapeptide phosphotransferase/UDP-N-acetylglucosamine-1-phosphate transferase [Marinisporobacter balticus]
MMISIIFLSVSFMISKFIMPMFFHLLYDTESIKDNYRGESIPVGLGLIFIPVITINTICLILWRTGDNALDLMFLIGCFAMGLAGLLDDLLGNRDVTGLKGHLKMMLKLKLTTGGFKAAFGGLVAFTISIIISKDPINIVMNTLIIAFFTNFINLLDLRPGRALKGFLISGVALVLNPIYEIFRYLLFGLMGATLAYLPYDLKAKSMMGDVGSNILGVSLGIVCASSDFHVRVVVLGFLVGIHIYTEKYSLTQTIQKVKILRYIDKIGR